MVARDPIADLHRRLGRGARPKAKVRAIVLAWWSDHGFADHPATVGKRIALALLERKAIEDKVAAIIVLGELLGDQLRTADLTSFARLFARRHLEDEVVVDAFATTVLGALVEREPGRADAIRTLTQWRTADTVWQRRAMCIAFAKLAPHGDEIAGITDAILLVCSTVVWSHEPLDQSAVGRVLRELARAEPVCVEAFFRRYARLMSKPCARLVAAAFPLTMRAELMTHHHRATTIGR